MLWGINVLKDCSEFIPQSLDMMPFVKIGLNYRKWAIPSWERVKSIFFKNSDRTRRVRLNR